MKVLVAYASRHGATKEIAERIAETLTERGVEATLTPAGKASDVAQYDAFVVGGATYAFHWMKEASKFVRRNTEVLAGSPTWLFSSGPLGADKIDPKTGKDVRQSAAPREFADFKVEINPRGEHIFFGAWDSEAAPIGMMEHVVHLIPPARDSLPSGDFRDWPEIEEWAGQIATQLQS